MRHRKRKNFFCPQCNKSFVFKHIMNKHIESHMSKKKSKICSQVSQSLSNSESQMPQKLKITKYQSPNCSAEGGNKTKGPKSRRHHICHYSDCGKVYSKTWILKRHVTMQHTSSNKKRFFCAYCNKNFKLKYMMEKHIQIHMKLKRTKCQCLYCTAEGGNKNKGPNGKLLHTCHYPKCGKVFGYPYLLKRHIAIQHNNKRKFFCPHCNKGFMFKGMMKKHLERHMNKKNHQNDDQVSQTLSISELQMPQKLEKPKCQCPNCSDEAGNKTIGSNGKPQHICHYPDCGKIYSATWHLKKHIELLHGDRKNFFCTHCSQGFVNKYMIKRHVIKRVCLGKKKLDNGNVNNKVSQSFPIPKTQTTEKLKQIKCQCPNCSAKGGNQTRNSVGRLLHACHITDCKRVYCYVSNLMRHIQQNHEFTCLVKSDMAGKQKDHCQCPKCNVISGNQTKDPDSSAIPYMCRHCKKSFPTNDDLKSHLKWYSSKENFFCAHCPKGYIKKKTLSRHVRVHMNTKSSELNDEELYICSMPNWHNGSSQLFNTQTFPELLPSS